MTNLLKASLMLVVLVVLQTKVFAETLTCKFKSDRIEKVQTIELENESLIINKELEIPLEVNRVKCGNFGRQHRFDGLALGFRVILKSCSSDAKLEGYIIDNQLDQSADVVCD
jgi:hypothetical protein